MEKEETYDGDWEIYGMMSSGVKELLAGTALESVIWEGLYKRMKRNQKWTEQ